MLRADPSHVLPRRCRRDLAVTKDEGKSFTGVHGAVYELRWWQEGGAKPVKIKPDPTVVNSVYEAALTSD
jgi:hypothetical protein